MKTRLTERDLSRIVKRVIKEQDTDMGVELPNFPEELIKLFQFFITEFYPEVDLGSSGPDGNGIDGVMGIKTYEASLEYSDEFINYLNDMSNLGDDFQKGVLKFEEEVGQEGIQAFFKDSGM